MINKGFSLCEFSKCIVNDREKTPNNGRELRVVDPRKCPPLPVCLSVLKELYFTYGFSTRSRKQIDLTINQPANP